MKNSAATIKMVRKYRLTELVNRHENRKHERSRLYQLRRELAQGYEEIDNSDLKSK